MNQNTEELNLLLEKSWLTPTKKRVLTGLALSLIVHSLGYVGYRFTPAIQMAYGLREIKFVDEDYDRAILLNLSKPLKYPGDYPGFTTPTKTLDLEKVKEAEKRRQQALEEAKRRAEIAARKKQKQGEIAPQKTEESAPQQASAKQPEATPKPTPSGFKPINTRPIRDQIQRLYDLNQEGKLVFNSTQFRVGVMGEIKSDGAITNARVFIPSGNKQIDQAAMAIIEAVSESRALGPLSDLTSLSMILSVDQDRAQLITVGFAPDLPTAANLQNAAVAAVFLGKKLKAADPASMIFLNNIQISQSGNRLQASISVPRQVAADTLAKTMIKKEATSQD